MRRRTAVIPVASAPWAAAAFPAACIAVVARISIARPVPVEARRALIARRSVPARRIRTSAAMAPALIAPALIALIARRRAALEPAPRAPVPGKAAPTCVRAVVPAAEAAAFLLAAFRFAAIETLGAVARRKGLAAAEAALFGPSAAARLAGGALRMPIKRPVAAARRVGARPIPVSPAARGTRTVEAPVFNAAFLARTLRPAEALPARARRIRTGPARTRAAILLSAVTGGALSAFAGAALSGRTFVFH